MLFKHRRSLSVDGEIISGVNDESLKVLLVIRKGKKNWHGRVDGECEQFLKLGRHGCCL